MAEWPSRKDRAEMANLQEISDQLGEAIHTAFRKASDHPSAWVIWKAIDDMPTEEWAVILDWIRNALELPAHSGLDSPHDPDDCPRVSEATT